MPCFRIASDAITDNHATLAGPVAHHIARVLRMRAGDAIGLTDGAGTRWHGTIAAITGRAVLVHIAHCTTELPPPLHITAAVAVLPQERWRLVLEKCVELGVATMQPILAQRGVVPKAALAKQSRWDAVMTQAAQQCERVWYPRLAAPCTVAQFFATAAPACDAVYFCAERRAPGACSMLSSGRVAVLIGPEGGWTPEEIQLAESRGVHPLALGPHILRTETAACAALTLLQAASWRPTAPHTV